MEGNWAKLLIAKTFGTVTKDKDKYWPIAGRRVSEIIAGRISAPNPVLFLKGEQESSLLIATKMVMPKWFNPTVGYDFTVPFVQAEQKER